MGKTKIKTVDESIQEEPKKEAKVAEEPTAKEVKTNKEEKAKEKREVKRSKKYLEALSSIDRSKIHSAKEAIELAQKASYSKFTGTIEAHLNTTAKNLRGLVALPYFAGKKLTILAFGKGAESCGADMVGDESTLAEIEKGKLGFDVVVTTPEWMPKFAKVAKILGPRGLMPNPKNGTITDNLSKTVTELRQGKVEYKTEPNGQVIHMAVGKADQSPEEIAANIKALYNGIGRSKVKKVTVAATMGPSVKVELSSLAA